MRERWRGLLAGGVLVGALVLAPVARAIDDTGGGLLGQQASICTAAGTPLLAFVQTVVVQPGVGSGQQIVAVVRVTNLGPLPQSTWFESDLADERGRRFEQTGAGETVNLNALAQQYNALPPSSQVYPGETTLHVWAWIVAPDVQALRLTNRAANRCA